MWSNRNSYSLLVGMQNGMDTMEDSLAVFYKNKHTLTILSNNYTPCDLPPKIENLCPHKNLQRCYSSCVRNAKMKQPIGRSVGEWINFGTYRQWNVSSAKKKEAVKP